MNIKLYKAFDSLFYDNDGNYKEPTNIEYNAKIREIRSIDYESYKNSINSLVNNFEESFLKEPSIISSYIFSNPSIINKPDNYFNINTYDIHSTNEDYIDNTLKIINNKIEFNFVNPNFISFYDNIMFDNLHKQFPMFSQLTIFIKNIFSSTLKNHIFLNKIKNINDIKKFTKGTNIEILILYFLQKNKLQQTNINQSNILQIFNLLINFFNNIHNETFIKLNNPYNYLGEEIKPEDVPYREQQIKELTTTLNQSSEEQLKLSIQSNIDKLQVDNIILKHYYYKINMFIKQDNDRKSFDPRYINTIRIIHPISPEPIWFGSLTEDSPIRYFIDFNVEKLKLIIYNQIYKLYKN